jgi:sec-independent protein translocase protein TatA
MRPGATELIIVAVLIMVLFGFKRLPDAARSLGRSARILKAETKGLRDDEDAPRAVETSAAPPAPRFDPVTGEPVARFDPYTGKPVDASSTGTPGATPSDRTP